MASTTNGPKENYEEKEMSVNKATKRNLERLHNMVLGKDQNINADYVKQFYLDIAKDYDDMLVAAGIETCQVIVNILSNFFPHAVDKSGIRISDVAAGTELVGE